MFGAGAAFEMRQIRVQLSSMRRVPRVRFRVSAASFTHNAEGLAGGLALQSGCRPRVSRASSMLQRFCFGNVRMGPVF